MLYFTEREIDDLLIEDVPYFDLTTSLLRLENKPAKVQYSTRGSTVVCCTEEAMKIFAKTGLQTTLFTPSGEYLEKGVKFLEGEGLAKNVFAISRTVENLLSFASGIATRTRQMVDIARGVNPDITIAVTRKVIPFTKRISTKAVKAGGASIHRLGLSESIQIFEDHFTFLGGIDKLGKRIREQKSLVGDKNIVIEVRKAEDAIKIANSGVDIIQLDKFLPQEMKNIRMEIDKINPAIKLAAAGNITIENVADYALSGASILVTSWPYFGRPADLSVNILPIFDMY
jgi:molybdenum transport protein